MTSNRTDEYYGKIFKCDGKWFIAIYNSDGPALIIKLDCHTEDIYTKPGCFTDLGESKKKNK